MGVSPSGGKDTTRHRLLLDIGPRRSFSWREELIRLAHDEGAFDNLPGAGKPLADLGESYDPDWWVKKLVRREKVSMLPPALELLRRVEAEVEQIWKLSDEREARERLRALNVEIARANARAAEGPPTRLAPLDVDTIVAEWRAARSSR
jgi:hypothetical protein